jgi:hypothetical protein
MMYHPSICMEGLSKPQKMSRRKAGALDEITTKHNLNENQKHYRFSQLAQLLSVRWRSLLLICIHKIIIWMACCSGVCSKCGYQLLMELDKSCHRCSILMLHMLMHVVLQQFLRCVILGAVHTLVPSHCNISHHRKLENVAHCKTCQAIWNLTNIHLL